MQNSKQIWSHVDARKEDYEALSDRVWGMPEIAYTEVRSVAEHKAMLEKEGFRIKENLAGIPTAVMGESGDGGPVIAILGEYDALPGLSQVAGIAEPKEVETGGHGHGCGHNMLGSAALLAATAVKNYLAEKGIKGRVRYYGCPAEEGGAASILLLDDDRVHLRHGAAPSLDPQYCGLIDGVAIGPSVGSCGTAAFTGKPVIVTDIATNPLWAEFKDIALGYGLRSCWSTPIFSAKGEVLGTFAMYSGSVRTPTRHEENIVEVATRIAGIAIERKRVEERISFMATHDALTGLANRSLLPETLKTAIDAAQPNGRWVSVVFVDLDNFKLVNDSLGHAAGDELLRIVAQRMQGCLGKSGTVIRLGGDEFVIVCANQAPTAKDVRAEVERIRHAISEQVKLGGQTFSVTSSIGVATYPQDGTDLETLISNADTAMYRSKQAGRDGIEFYAPDLRAAAQDELVLRNELRSALANNEFVLHYQPQIEVGAGKIIGVEALIRWRHPRLGLLAPAAFIPAAEDTGLIVPIGDWVLKEACRQACEWQRSGFAPLRVCVNVSARQFRGDCLVTSVAEALTGSGLASKHLELELTESLLMHDADSAVETIKALQEMGVAVSIDDFGTGHSSLGALKTFPVSRLKIDKSFIKALSQQAGKAMASAVVSLGHALDLSVVAEGVETEAQAEFLASIGCDVAQGYLYSEPRSAEAVEAILRANGGPTDTDMRGAA